MYMAMSFMMYMEHVYAGTRAYSVTARVHGSRQQPGMPYNSDLATHAHIMTHTIVCASSCGDVHLVTQAATICHCCGRHVGM
jgi:hypothetical protein